MSWRPRQYSNSLLASAPTVATSMSARARSAPATATPSQSTSPANTDAVSSLPLNEKQLQALAFIKVRPDATNQEIADRVGVALRTIGNWKKLPEWKEGMAMLPEAILKDAMFLKAVSGDTSAFDKWMKNFGSDKKPEDEFAVALNMTEDEMEMIAREAHDYWRARKGRVTEPAPAPEPAFEPAF